MISLPPRHPLLAWALGVSLRTKILGIALLLALLLGLSVTRELQLTFMRTLREEIEAEGRYVASNIAEKGTALLLNRDRAALHDLAESFVEASRSIRYVVFRDATGRVLTHTFRGAMPPEVRNIPGPAEKQDHTIRALEIDGDPIRDISLRPLRRDAGWVQVGVGEEWLKSRVQQMTDEMLFGVVVVTLLALAAAYLLTAVLTRPLQELRTVSQSVAEGDFSQRARVFADDEVGALARVFNLMCERLSLYREEIENKERLRIELLQRVIDAQEDERKRVARELHDHTSQSLTSLAVELRALEEGAESAASRAQVQRLRETVSRTLGEVHHLAFELRPNLLDDLGLVAAIEHHLAEFEEGLGIPVDFQTLGGWTCELPPEVEITLYRICQEALTNAARHAEAEHLSVVLTRRDDAAVAIIEDDGQGFDADATLSGTKGQQNLGLFGMQERAALVGGKLTVESSPGQGTTIFVEIPCARTEPSNSLTAPEPS